MTNPTDKELLELAAAEMDNSPNWEEPEYSAGHPFPYEAPGVAWVNFARAVLARFGNHSPDATKIVSPAPAPAGEVAEVAAWLRAYRDEEFGPLSDDPDTRWLTRAADLLEHQAAPVPVAVSERLPEPSVKVLAHYFNDLGKGRTICAIWVPAKTRSDSYGDDGFTEDDEESDTFYWPEGWYETIENWDDLGYVKVDEGEVIYWQPLPKWPANALPLPGGEVQHG